MKRRMIILVALLGMTAVPAGAQAPAETPFPSPKIVGTFVRVRTVTAPNSAYLTNFFHMEHRSCSACSSATTRRVIR